MLVITRKENEKITIGKDITITVVKLSSNQVKIGIEAPEDLKIWRTDYRGGDANSNNKK